MLESASGFQTLGTLSHSRSVFRQWVHFHAVDAFSGDGSVFILLVGSFSGNGTVFQVHCQVMDTLSCKRGIVMQWAHFHTMVHY